MNIQEFIQKYNKDNDTQYSSYDVNEKLMIEFAKYHVEKALEAAVEDAWVECRNYDEYNVNKDSILKAYSLDNIK